MGEKNKKMKPKDEYTKEQVDLLDDFKNKADKLGFEYFALVGDPKTNIGASIYKAIGEDSAARNAREAHKKWEIEHGIDPDHDRNS